MIDDDRYEGISLKDLKFGSLLNIYSLKMFVHKLNKVFNSCFYGCCIKISFLKECKKS